jgi:hypothetical protein
MSGFFGPSIASGDVANTITVADATARLALAAGTGTGQVQPGDVVLQADTTPDTAWVLIAADPTAAASWAPVNPALISVGRGTEAAEAPFHARSSTGPQEIWEYADGVDARITVDEYGNAVIDATGAISLTGDIYLGPDGGAGRVEIGKAAYLPTILYFGTANTAASINDGGSAGCMYLNATSDSLGLIVAVDGTDKFQANTTGVGFFGVTPAARQLVPTGSDADDIITALQTLGLFRQS